ncbi:MAG: P27 family phage terminase small subunit [Gemmatimonadetes bacterium]|nr:P27 family phage terminase small subunit [Gemmatimonadota bacterium]
MAKPRTPAALKLMQGTDQPCRAREEADFPLVTGAQPPDWLVGPVAVDEWHTRVGQLEASGILTTADLTALAIYCNMLARAVLKWDMGGEPSSAEVTQLRMMLNEFGFTPTTEANL